MMTLVDEPGCGPQGMVLEMVSVMLSSGEDATAQRTISGSALVSWSCLIKLREAGCFAQQKCVLSQVWRPEVQN